MKLLKNAFLVLWHGRWQKHHIEQAQKYEKYQYALLHHRRKLHMHNDKMSAAADYIKERRGQREEQEKNRGK